MPDARPIGEITAAIVSRMVIADPFLDDEGNSLTIGMTVQVLHSDVIAGAVGVIVGLDTLNDNYVPKGEEIVWVRLNGLDALSAFHPARLRRYRKAA